MRWKGENWTDLTPLKLCAAYVKELNIYHGLDTTHNKEDEHQKGHKCAQNATKD